MVGIVEDVLDAVAVVGIDVYVEHFHATGQQVLDGDRRVVEHAEAGGMVGCSVVETSRYVEGDVDRAIGHHVSCYQRCSSAEAGGFVHTGVGGVVAAGAEVEQGLALHAETAAETPDGVEVLGSVDRQYLCVGGRAWLHEFGTLAGEGSVGVQ